MQNKFAFFANFAETIQATFETTEEQAAAYMAICQYGIFGFLPEDKTMKAMCLMAKSSIYSQGGAPEGNQNARKKTMETIKNKENNLKQPKTTETTQNNSLLETETETETETEKEEGVKTPQHFDLTPLNLVFDRFGLPQVQKLTEERRRKLKLRCQEVGGFEAFIGQVEAALEKSAFLRGDNNRTWRADFDFFLRKTSWQKVLEGTYADKKNKNDDDFYRQLEAL